MAGTHRRMDPADRAKQFMPFDALKGLREAMAEKERRSVPRKELYEEHLEELDRTLGQLAKGDRIEAVYFSEGEYVELTGTVAGLDRTGKVLRAADCVIKGQTESRQEEEAEIPLKYIFRLTRWCPGEW